MWCFSSSIGHTSNLPLRDIKARGVVASFYSGTERTPSVTVHIDNIYTDYERKGFFRIGVLPLGVMDGFTLKILHTDSITNSLAQMQNWISARAGKRMEFRNVKLLAGVGSTNRLESSHARILSGGRWELFGTVQFYCGTNVFTAPHTTLQVIGPQTGKLVFATVPPCTNHLFSRIQFPIFNQKEAHEINPTPDASTAVDVVVNVLSNSR